MTKQTNKPTTLEEILKEFNLLFFVKNGEMQVDTILDLEAFIKKVYEAGYDEGYRQGVADEIECVETAGEHVDLRKLLNQKPT